MLGEPFQRTVTGANRETWSYMYVNSSAAAVSVSFHTDVSSKMINKNAQFVLIDGIVESFVATF